MGNAFYQEKNYKEAIPQYELTVKTAKTKLKRLKLFTIWEMLIWKAKLSGAVDAFKNALRNNPSDDETRYNCCCAKLLDKEKKQNKDKDKDKKDKGKDDQKKNKDKKEGEDKRPEKKRIKTIKIRIKINQIKKTRGKSNSLNLVKVK